MSAEAAEQVKPAPPRPAAKPAPSKEHKTATTQPTDSHAQAGPFYTAPEFWVAVAFLIVVGFAFRKVTRAVAAALDMRAEKIKAKLDEARNLREDAQSLLAEYQRKQRDAMNEAEDILAHARAEAQRHKKEAVAEIEVAIKRREAQAMARIAQAESQAMAEVRNMAVDIAIAASQKLIADTLTVAQADALIDQTIRDLPRKLQ